MEMKTESPNREFFPNDVLAILQRGPATRGAISDEIGCSIGTVWRLVVKLIEDGYDIGFNGQGYFLLDPSLVTDLDKDETRKWQSYQTRLYNMFLRLARRAGAHLPVAKQLRRRLAGELTRDERTTLKQELLTFTRVIDAVDLDEELGE